MKNVSNEGTSKIYDNADSSEEKLDSSNQNMYNSTDKSDDCQSRKISTDHDESYSDSKFKSAADSKEVPSHSPTKVAVTKDEVGENSQIGKSLKEEDEEESKPKDDPDFCYKAPRKQRFEYNKRKDVILKTILRKCRRVLQDDFNKLTDYFSNRKMQGHQFLKDCIVKYHDSIPNKPPQLDLIFYLGAMLYPQKMSRGVDCFFECEKKERVKQRKVYRSRIQKVHDVLYRYSHEKMDYFVSVPELSYIYVLFYNEETKRVQDDPFYLNGATEIYERCRVTLESAGIFL